MKKSFVLISVVFAALLYISVSVFVAGEEMREIKELDLGVTARDIQFNRTVKPDLNFGKFPLYFIANKGQVNKKAKFYAKASRYTLWLTREGLVFDSTRQVEKSDTPRPLRGHPSQEGSNQLPHLPNSPHSPYSPKRERDVSRFIFLNANKNPGIIPIDESMLRVNYFIGNDPSKWYCDVPTSLAVLYKNLYKNIDLKVYGIEKQIEYDWIVKAGGNPRDIKFEYKNVKGTRIDEEGNLLIETDFGELIHKKPVSYQEIGMVHSVGVGAGLRACPKELICPKERKYVNVTFKKIAESTYGFEVGEYDKRFELIIDPVVLVYSTYLGGNGDDNGYGIAVDSIGNVYLTGYTASTDFPTLNQYETGIESSDAFVTKINTTEKGASSLIYSTYLGGMDMEAGTGIAVDNKGNAYVAGYTWSRDFPTLNQYQTYQGGYTDAFVTKVDTTRQGISSLIYSTYLGGGEGDSGQGIAVEVNGSGNAYVIGTTTSTNFPTLNQYQTHQSGWDAFVTKIDTAQKGASSLIYSTYLGGRAIDYGRGIAVDVNSRGNIYVTGSTTSTNFPTLNQYQTHQSGWDAFVTKIDTAQKGASSLIYSTYLGGEAIDHGRGIAMDVNSRGNVCVIGSTASSNFPTLNQYQTHQGDYDVFVIKIDTTRNGTMSLIYSTYLGGVDSDCGLGIAIDSSGNAYVTGFTESTDFPTLNQYQTDITNTDAIVAMIDTTQKGVASLIYSTYLGGGSHDYGRGIAVDSIRNVYVTGFTASTDFPIVNQYQIAQTSNDAFVTKLINCTGAPYIKLNRTRLNFGAIIGESRTGSQAFLISNSGKGGLNWTAISNETWIQVNPTYGTDSGQVTVSLDITGLTPGPHTGTISITDACAANSPQTVSVILNIYNSGGTGAEGVPFGMFSTPVDGSTVRSSIPVTGWVLDDIEVESVKIYREQDGAYIFIGDAVFVEGARPDVEQAYPMYPFNYRAGWGYMLLTNFLPGGGNGIFTLYALATDKEGNVVTLETKTIICDNANAVKPFGAIDTPTQGGDAAGAEFINFAWALTPKPNTIPINGSTIKVWVDGVPLEGNPVYNRYRKDVAALFPGYNNSEGAGGYYYLDTTLYANGVHTIAWSVTDDAGNTDGIGSRYFNVMNVNNPSATSASTFNYSYRHHDKFSIEHLPAAASPVYLKKGYKVSSAQNAYYPGSDGIITIEIKEGERIEIQSTSSGYYCGYMVVGHQLKPLPVGSFLDTKRGIFYWQVGVGFIGKYRLVFIEKSENGEFKKKHIDVMIHPEY